jgi:hypothetical protein
MRDVLNTRMRLIGPAEPYSPSVRGGGAHLHRDHLDEGFGERLYEGLVIKTAHSANLVSADMGC